MSRTESNHEFVSSYGRRPQPSPMGSQMEELDQVQEAERDKPQSMKMFDYEMSSPLR